jgi:predicted ATPase
MFVERLRVQNFRSFRELNLQLSPFSVLVGANASGKTNFVQLFRFLRDVANEGFESAIALQGGVELLRNLRLGATMPLEIEIEGAFHQQSTPSRIIPRRYHYKLSIEFTRGRTGYRIAEESINVLLDYSETGIREVSLTRRGNRALLPPVLFRGAHPQRRRLAPGQSLLQIEWMPFLPTLFSMALTDLSRFLKTIVAYDFDVRALKRPARLESRPHLEESGENLASVLRRLLQNRERRRRFHQLLQQFLPEVQGVSVQVGPEKTVSYSIREQHLGRQKLPSYRLSEGTTELTALIVAIYFSPARLLLIEEPDRHLHPALMERLVHHLKETTWRRQVIVTTHNPEMVRHTPLDSLLLVQRDREGFSQITRPTENEQVRNFLQHELGIHELFVDNLLEAAHAPLPAR